MIDRLSEHVCTRCGLRAKGKFGMHQAGTGPGRWVCTGKVVRADVFPAPSQPEAPAGGRSPRLAA